MYFAVDALLIWLNLKSNLINYKGFYGSIELKQCILALNSKYRPSRTRILARASSTKKSHYSITTQRATLGRP